MINHLDKSAADKALLKRELEKGLASGLSNRTPEQVRLSYQTSRS
jgi:hypothetical protein